MAGEEKGTVKEKATTPEEEALERDLIAWVKAYAAEKGYALNTDERQFRAVIRGLVRNKLRHGEQYCPCRIRSGDPEKDRLIICPCAHQEGEIEAEGHCHCNLFFRITG